MVLVGSCKERKLACTSCLECWGAWRRVGWFWNTAVQVTHLDVASLCTSEQEDCHPLMTQPLISVALPSAGEGGALHLGAMAVRFTRVYEITRINHEG